MEYSSQRSWQRIQPQQWSLVDQRIILGYSRTKCQIQVNAILCVRRTSHLRWKVLDICQDSCKSHLIPSLLLQTGWNTYFRYPPILPWTLHSVKLPVLSLKPRIPRGDFMESVAVTAFSALFTSITRYVGTHTLQFRSDPYYPENDWWPVKL